MNGPVDVKVRVAAAVETNGAVCTGGGNVLTDIGNGDPQPVQNFESSTLTL
jgi:hypothetical protein